MVAEADTIAANKGDPKTRNRYNYVSNNPVKFTDPTGHCIEKTDCLAENSQRQFSDSGVCLSKECAARVLYDYGFELDLGEWELSDLILVIQAIEDLMSVAGWDVRDFRDAMGTADGYTLLRNADLNSKPGSGADPTGKKMTRHGFTAGAVTKEGRKILALDISAMKKAARDDRKIDYGALLKRTMVHELAHLWDRASGWRFSQSWGGAQGNVSMRDSAISRGEEKAITEYGDSSAAEDWAEAVAAYVYNKDPVFTERYSNPRNTKRGEYVYDRFRKYDK